MIRPLATALILLAAAAPADPFALDWLATCRASAATPAAQGACAEDAIRLVCAYARSPDTCRDTVEATVTADALSRLTSIATRQNLSPRALLESLPGWVPPPDCRRPPPPLTEAGCRGAGLGALLAAVSDIEGSTR